METVFERLVENSIAASVLAVLFLGVLFLSRGRIGPFWSVVFSVVVFVRLLLPVSWESSWSVFNLKPDSAAEASPDQEEDFDFAVPERLFGEEPKLVSTPPSSEIVIDWSFDPFALPEELASPAVLEITDETAGNDEPAEFLHYSEIPVLPVLWMGGVALMLVLILCGQVRLVMRLRACGRPASRSMSALLDECRTTLGIRRQVPVVVAGRLVDSAALFGVARPRLLISSELEENFSVEEVRGIFLHELAHLRRGDLWWNWFGSLVLALHWFNPLVWYVVRRFRADRELLCDRLAARFLSDPSLYSRVLLKLVSDFSPGRKWNRYAAVRPGMATIVNRKSELKHRILMIHKYPQLSPVVHILAVVAVLAACAVTFPSAKAEEEGGKDAQPPEHKEREVQRDGDRPREGDTPREHPEREMHRDRDGQKPRAEGDKGRPQPEREARRDGDRPAEGGRPRVGDRDQDHPEREARREGDRAKPEGRFSSRPHAPGPDPVERQADLNRRIGELHMALGEAFRNRQPEEAGRIEREIRELHLKFAEQGPGRPFQARGPVEARNPVQARNPEPQGNPVEAEQRLRHLNMAAENLEQAGLTEESRRYRAQAAEIERALHNRMEQRGGPDAERAERLEREVRELHEVVGDLRREIERLQDQLNAKSR